MGVWLSRAKRALGAVAALMVRRRFAVALVAIAITATASTATAIGWRHDPTRLSATAPPVHRSATASPPISAASVPLVIEGAALPASAPVALFVGASYTAGLGAQPATNGYAYRSAALLGWRAEVDGESGTGYLNPGHRGGSTYVARIRVLAPPLPPSVVVVQSGRNDIGYPLPQLHDAVLATVASVHRRWRHAQLVILGAIPADLPLGPGILGVEATLKQAATQAKVPFVDPIAQDWITAANEHQYAGAVPQHPNNSGHAYLASRLAADLQAALPHSPAPQVAAPNL